MTVGGNQPFFMPYIVYFQLIKAVDTFLIADEYILGTSGWANRNKILMQGKEYQITLPLIGKSSLKKFNEVSFVEDQSKFLRTIEVCYSKAPYFKSVFPIIREIFLYDNKNLARLVGNSLMLIADYLHFDTKFLYMSEIKGLNSSLKAQDRVLDFCSVLKTTRYINIWSRTELYDKKTFQEHGIELCLIKSKPIEYKQYDNPFVPNLSMLDVLMFNSVEQTNELLLQCELL